MAIAQRRRHAKRQVEFRQVRRLRLDVSQKVDRGLIDSKIHRFHFGRPQRPAAGGQKHGVDGGMRMAAGGVILDRVALRVEYLAQIGDASAFVEILRGGAEKTFLPLQDSPRPGKALLCEQYRQQTVHCGLPCVQLLAHRAFSEKLPQSRRLGPCRSDRPGELVLVEVQHFGRPGRRSECPAGRCRVPETVMAWLPRPMPPGYPPRSRRKSQRSDPFPKPLPVHRRQVRQGGSRRRGEGSIPGAGRPSRRYGKRRRSPGRPSRQLVLTPSGMDVASGAPPRLRTTFRIIRIGGRSFPA